MLQPPPAPEVPAVTPAEAERLVAEGGRLLDVREADEWAEARIPGADWKPMSAINDWYADLSPDETLVVYCRSGQRSARVVEALIGQAGFTDVHNLEGGLLRWAKDGLAVDEGPEPAWGSAPTG